MTRWIIAGAISLGLLAGGAGVALATSGPDDGEGHPITGDALDKAKTAALREAGGGRVTGTEAGDEEGYYEVEVTMPDGHQLDVHLDQKFTVLGSKSDGGDSGEEGR